LNEFVIRNKKNMQETRLAALLPCDLKEDITFSLPKAQKVVLQYLGKTNTYSSTGVLLPFHLTVRHFFKKKYISWTIN
jgi:hypothetical protein